MTNTAYSAMRYCKAPSGRLMVSLEDLLLWLREAQDTVTDDGASIGITVIADMVADYWSDAAQASEGLW